MKVTDTCVCPYPAGNSSIRRMAQEARELGFDSLVAIGVCSVNYCGLEVLGGAIISGVPAQEAAARAKRYHKTGTVVFIQAGDNGFNRAVLGIKGINVMCGIHASDRHAFDHMTAKIAADNGVAIDISLEPVIRQRGAARQRALNRYLDILMLSRKFSFPLVLSTHASSVLGMRSVREMSALASLVGFDLLEIERALTALEGIITQQEPVRVIT